MWFEMEFVADRSFDTYITHRVISSHMIDSMKTPAAVLPDLQLGKKA